MYKKISKKVFIHCTNRLPKRKEKNMHATSRIEPGYKHFFGYVVHVVTRVKPTELNVFKPNGCNTFILTTLIQIIL